MAILITRDKSGCKRYFAGFFADNTICWSTVEENALDKTLGEFRAITNLFGLEQYNIRERISRTPTFLDPTRELERMESQLHTLAHHILSISIHKTRAINGKESKLFYAAQLTGTRHNGEHIYKSIDGDSLPDLFSKISNQI